jgi:hypothetical protein
VKKNKKPHRPRREPPRLTLGDVFGEAIAKDRAEKERRRELEDMGFRPIKGA